jgi:hypothetical protein
VKDSRGTYVLLFVVTTIVPSTIDNGEATAGGDNGECAVMPPCGKYSTQCLRVSTQFLDGNYTFS